MAGQWDEMNAKVIAEFRANEGKVGGGFEGAPMILVHHIGARTGTERVLPLVYFPQDDGTIVIIASKGGAPDNPDWYHNLKANPDITVEVGTETFPVRVTEPTGEDRDKIFAASAAAMPQFAEYQEKTSRTIPVLVLTRSS